MSSYGNNDLIAYLFRDPYTWYKWERADGSKIVGDKRMIIFISFKPTVIQYDTVGET